VKTDRRDATKLAHYLRPFDLTTIAVPDPKPEAIRDVERARDDAKQDESRARHRLGKFHLRHDRRWTGKTNWTNAHLEWIGNQRFEDEAQNQVLREYLRKLEEAPAAVDRVSAAIGEAVEGWALKPLVRDLQALRGEQLLTAVVIAAEVGDLRRFPSAKKFMAYLGLVLTENSSGGSVQRGGITRTGNKHHRRLLVEAAWSYRFSPKKSREKKGARNRPAGGGLDRAPFDHHRFYVSPLARKQGIENECPHGSRSRPVAPE
jgi:transposase